MLHAIIANKWTHIIAIPLFLLFIGVLARRLGRRDGDTSPRLNDLAVGTSILLMAFSALITDFRNVDTPEASTNQLLILIGVMFSTFISIDHDRYKSWERDCEGLPTNKKKLWNGIVLPNLASLLIFVCYQAYKSGVL